MRRKKELIKINHVRSQKGGDKASKRRLQSHNKEIWEHGKIRLYRKKTFLKEKTLSSESTLISSGILVNPNNRLKIGTSGDISTW